MKTLWVALALVIGTTFGVNAQTQTAKPGTTTTKTTTTTTTVHSTSQPNTTHQVQPQAQAQTKVMIKSAELPKAIKENLASQFKGWAESQAYKLDTKGVVSYEVMVKKETNEMLLFYDKDGKFMKQEPVTAAAKQPENKKVVAPAKPADQPKK